MLINGYTTNFYLAANIASHSSHRLDFSLKPRHVASRGLTFVATTFDPWPGHSHGSPQRLRVSHGSSGPPSVAPGTQGRVDGTAEVTGARQQERLHVATICNDEVIEVTVSKKEKHPWLISL